MYQTIQKWLRCTRSTISVQTLDASSCQTSSKMRPPASSLDFAEVAETALLLDGTCIVCSLVVRGQKYLQG
uniref:Uncharacterized protein n=1 Tax=Anguilla anguilla TaxID=7936 RepID=A0A0E9XI87_ANGAN